MDFLDFFQGMRQKDGSSLKLHTLFWGILVERFKGVKMGVNIKRRNS